MAYYELMYFVKADTDENAQNEILQKVKSLIEKKDGKILYEENLGKRQLATIYSKQTHGIYFLLQYETPTSANREIEEYFKISEAVVRNLLLKIKPEMLIQAKKSKIAKKEEATAEA